MVTESFEATYRAGQLRRALPYCRRALDSCAAVLNAARPEAIISWEVCRDIKPLRSQLAAVARLCFFGGVRGSLDNDDLGLLVLRARLHSARGVVALGGELSPHVLPPVAWLRALEQTVDALNNQLDATSQPTKGT